MKMRKKKIIKEIHLRIHVHVHARKFVNYHEQKKKRLLEILVREIIKKKLHTLR